MKKLITYPNDEIKVVVCNNKELATNFANAKVLTEVEFKQYEGDYKPMYYIYTSVCDLEIAKHSSVTVAPTPQTLSTSGEPNNVDGNNQFFYVSDIYKGIHFCNEHSIYMAIENKNNEAVVNTFSKVQDIVKISKLDKYAQTILGNRITRDDFLTLSDLLNPTATELLTPLEDPEVVEASKLLDKHLKANSKILVYTDSDGDGISCATIATAYGDDYLSKQFKILVNRRELGNGINDVMLMEMIEWKPDLIITADHGSNDVSAVQIIVDNGIDLIITDHHTLETVPNATVHVNPQSESSTLPPYISGAFVLYLVFLRHYRDTIDSNALVLGGMAEIVGLSTVSDMMNQSKPINRFMTLFALSYLQNNPFVKLYLQAEGTSRVTMQNLQMGINPMINSTNRLEVPTEGVKALRGVDPTTSLKLLKSLNNKRKRIQKEAMEYAMNNIYEYPSMAVALSSPGSEGVIGILASQIGSILGKPCFVFADVKDESTNKIKGSGRGNAVNVNLAQSIKTLMKPYKSYEKPLIMYGGGHAGAAGCNILKENLDNVAKELSAYIDSTFGELIFHDGIDFVDPTFDEVQNIYSSQARLEPYGIGFHPPLLQSTIKVIEAVYYVKSKTYMFKGSIDNTNRLLDFISFNASTVLQDTVAGDTLTLVYKAQASMRGGGITCIVEPFKR